MECPYFLLVSKKRVSYFLSGSKLPLDTELYFFNFQQNEYPKKKYGKSLKTFFKVKTKRYPCEIIQKLFKIKNERMKA